jgi:allophanate hydrolase subunit 2
LGPEAELFTEQALHTLVNSSFVVNAASDGMGLRLDGPPVAYPPQILSEGQAAGSVQIPPSGQPIVLLAGRQTLGGYAKIAVVGRPDLSKLSQAIPGDVVTLSMVSLQESVGLTRQWLSKLLDPSLSTIPYNG